MNGFAIRPASPADLQALDAISAATWDGDDYLSDAAPRWIEEGGFFVGEHEGRVVGCAKLSRMPGGVVWLEGLRIHPDAQGRGWGKALSTHVTRLAERIVAEGKASCIEFCTYYKNERSIAISKAAGFESVEEFVIIGIQRPGCPASVARCTGLCPRDLSCYAGHVPFSWKPPLNTPGALEWLEGQAEVWQHGSAKFFNRAGTEDFSLCSSGLAKPSDAAEGILAAAGMKGLEYCCAILPWGDRRLLDEFLDRGFHWWEEPHEPNVLIFRKSPGTRGAF